MHSKTKANKVKVNSNRVIKVTLKSGAVRTFRSPNKRTINAIRRYTG